jgi:hypothetical protein
MRFRVVSSQSLTGWYSFNSASGVRSENHGRAGLVSPLIMPLASVRMASVAVLSIILLLRRSPRFRSVTRKRDCRGKM